MAQIADTGGGNELPLKGGRLSPSNRVRSYIIRKRLSCASWSPMTRMKWRGFGRNMYGIPAHTASPAEHGNNFNSTKI